MSAVDDYDVLVAMLKQEGATWVKFSVAKDEFPSNDNIEQYEASVITGSQADADANDPWIMNLMELLENSISMKKKILGICFGHQILARTLGGKTSRNTKGWDIGIKKVNLNPTSKIFASLDLPAYSLNIVQCHRDEVKELPPRAEILAWSDKTGVEMFKYDDYVIGIQGHPESSKDVMPHIVGRLMNHNLIEESFAEEIMSEVEGSEADCEIWKDLCLKFLKGKKGF